MDVALYKSTNYEKIKLTSSSAIFKIIYHNGSQLMLFGKGKVQSLEISGEKFFLL